MKHLVIAEKPSVGRDIARVLHCNKKTNTYIEGTDYIVTWALGQRRNTMKHLVIAEKPSVGRDIARVLHCNKKTNTYIEGTDYIVTWALGHLVTLADPEQYDEQPCHTG